MTILSDPRENPIVIKAIGASRLYQMEYKDNRNNLMYIILKLYELGVSDQQLKKVYKQMIRTMDSMLMPKVPKSPIPLHINDWLNHLGDKDMYSSYFDFFDRQITLHGLQHTLQYFFYNSPLAYSIGSHRIPMVHLALGLKYTLPEIICQGLSYLATSYQDASFLLQEVDSNNMSSRFTLYEILISQVKVDPRFGSFPTGIQDQPTKTTCHKMLKHNKELLRNYVYLWRIPNHTSDAIQELRILAAQMMISSFKNELSENQVDLNNPSGISLLKTINAMEILYPNGECPIDLIRVQFLNVICLYILQGKPNIMPYNKIDNTTKTTTNQNDIYQTRIKNILDKQDVVNIKTISAISALEEANKQDVFFNEIMPYF